MKKTIPQQEVFLLTADNLSECHLDSNFEFKPKRVRVSLHEVVLITTDSCSKNYVCFQTIKGEKFYLKSSLKNLMSKVDQNFIQIKNHLLINTSFITGINGLSNVYVGTRSDYRLYTVSRNYQAAMRRFMQLFNV